MQSRGPIITAESSTSIARPATEVFEFVSDLRNDPRWHTDILKARLTGEWLVAPGATFAIRFKPFMGKSEGTITVSEYEPRVALCFGDGWGRWLPTVILTIEPQAEGSRFTRRVEMEPPGIMRWMALFMGGMFRKQNAGFVANLKRVLEGS